MNPFYIITVFGLLYAILTAGSAVYFLYKNRKNQNVQRMPRSIISAGSILRHQVILLTLIISLGYLFGITPEDIGVSQTFGFVPAFILGFGVYLVLLGMVEATAYVLGIRDRLHDLSFETMRMIWPRRRKHKYIAIVAVCLLNPFTEEVLFRGVLVHMLGEQIGNPMLAAVLALTLSVLAHTYQGLWSAPFQFLFHGTAVLLVLSPMGLAGAFGLHFAGDLVPVAGMKKSMLEWRNRRRRELRTEN